MGERGREGGIVFDAFVIRLLIDELPLCRGALSLGKLLERIRLCALLHEADEGLCPMGGMQRDQGELAIEYPLHDGFHACVVLLLDATMAPEDEDIRVVECLIAEPLLRLVETRGFHG